MSRSSGEHLDASRPTINHSISTTSQVGLLNGESTDNVAAPSTYTTTPGISRANSIEQHRPLDVNLGNPVYPTSGVPSVSVTNFEDVNEKAEASGSAERPEFAASRASSMFSGFKRRSKAPSRAQSVRSVAGKSFRSGMTGKTNATTMTARKPFQSTRLKGEIYKPWLEHKDPALRWARWITLACIAIGFGLAGYSECNVGPFRSSANLAIQSATTVFDLFLLSASFAKSWTTTLATVSTLIPGAEKSDWTVMGEFTAAVQ